MNEEDRKAFLALADKYKIHCMTDEYPDWLVADMRKRVLEETRFLIRNIIQANSIFPTSVPEFVTRRSYQTRAIGCCEQLIQEFQYVLTVIDVNVNKYLPYVDMLEKEIALLRAWRKSDNRLLKSVYGLEAERQIAREGVYNSLLENLKLAADNKKKKEQAQKKKKQSKGKQSNDVFDDAKAPDVKSMPKEKRSIFGIAEQTRANAEKFMELYEENQRIDLQKATTI